MLETFEVPGLVKVITPESVPVFGISTPVTDVADHTLIDDGATPLTEMFAPVPPLPKWLPFKVNVPS